MLIFLLIRYTGARLNEVLKLDIAQDFDFNRNTVRFGKRPGGKEVNTREMQPPEIIRKSRAVELMRSDMPLPVIQRILGHSSPSRAASSVEFFDASAVILHID